MISPRVTTQAEIDAALEKMGITPTGQYTKDESQQLYVNKEGKGLILPASVEGYSYYSVEDILGHVQRIASAMKVVDTVHYAVETDFKIERGGK